MKIISNKIRTEPYMFIGSSATGAHNLLSYSDDNKKSIILKAGDIIQVEEFTTFCKVDGRKNCKGCAKLDGVTEPVCFQYGTGYGLKGV